jgi:dienelactone hydrolase
VIRVLALLTGLLAGILLRASPAAAEEALSFPSLSSDMVTGSLFLPEGPPPYAAIVGLHGAGGLSAAHDRWARRLAANGYAMLLVDSYTPRGYREIGSIGLHIVPVAMRLKDAFGALLYLRSRPEIDAARVALLGWSQGGTTALAAAATLRRTLVGPDVPLFAAAVALYPRCNQDMETAEPAGDTPLLALLGGADIVTPATACDTLFHRWTAGGAAVDMVLYPEAPHSFDFANPLSTMLVRAAAAAEMPSLGVQWTPVDDAEQRVLRFLDRVLAP